VDIPDWVKERPPYPQSGHAASPFKEPPKWSIADVDLPRVNGIQRRHADE